ncbi:hypothetical protein DUNSADRAFT_14122 [Dunaliella salina]|uniref:Encoded protein n=1 Tax=Dunaliella salina TaxID=3046 RepID=A0ABQ7G7X8_DUNSA|nr:hypothetical protein DUNSADRAFT_14122 [Dunaliella salina]|eukprot:KAF5830716.1 hypothetical protein DUNSADRAFT_14122 [Dunaliella salina]
MRAVKLPRKLEGSLHAMEEEGCQSNCTSKEGDPAHIGNGSMDQCERACGRESVWTRKSHQKGVLAKPLIECGQFVMQPGSRSRCF